MVWFIDGVKLRDCPPYFPMTRLHPFLHGRSPVLSSAKPKQKPVSRVSAPYSSTVQSSIWPAQPVFLAAAHCWVAACMWRPHSHMAAKRGHVNARDKRGFPKETELCPFGACRWLLSGLSPHPGSLACSRLIQWQNPCGCQP